MAEAQEVVLQLRWELGLSENPLGLLRTKYLADTLRQVHRGSGSQMSLPSEGHVDTLLWIQSLQEEVAMNNLHLISFDIIFRPLPRCRPRNQGHHRSALTQKDSAIIRRQPGREEAHLDRGGDNGWGL
jgi:hypothetical protein